VGLGADRAPKFRQHRDKRLGISTVDQPFDPELRTERCVACGEPMYAGAELCGSCRSLQDWRRYLLVWKDVIATLPIFFGVLGAMYTVFKLSPSPEISLLDPRCLAEEATFTVANTGNLAGIFTIVGISRDGISRDAYFGTSRSRTILVPPNEFKSFSVKYQTVTNIGSPDCTLMFASGSRLSWMYDDEVTCQCPVK